jgi:hypothetical protein
MRSVAASVLLAAGMAAAPQSRPRRCVDDAVARGGVQPGHHERPPAHPGNDRGRRDDARAWRRPWRGQRPPAAHGGEQQGRPVGPPGGSTGGTRPPAPSTEPVAMCYN